MIGDYHIHIERGNYSKEWIDNFVKFGLSRGIEEFGIVEHTHRLKETISIYSNIIKDSSRVGAFNNSWLIGKGTIETQNYIDFINGLKNQGYPVKLGIEVCYFEESEDYLRDYLSRYDFDFIIGSVHWIDGWGFDFRESLEQWKERDIASLYNSYFNLLIKAAKSELFDIIGHCDSIKIFGYKPNNRLTEFYHKTSEAFKANNLCVEINSGLMNRYNATEFCPSREFLEILFDYKIPISVSSDAHTPEDTGRNIDKAIILAKEIGYKEVQRFENRNRIPTYIGGI